MGSPGPVIALLAVRSDTPAKIRGHYDGVRLQSPRSTDLKARITYAPAFSIYPLLPAEMTFDRCRARRPAQHFGPVPHDAPYESTGSITRRHHTTLIASAGVRHGIRLPLVKRKWGWQLDAKRHLFSP
jgi:hypothetical protein